MKLKRTPTTYILGHSQRGVALITILVMVAIATILAATIAKRQKHTAENTAYLVRQNQALLYAKSAEAFASELLVQDSNSGGGADYLQETWAQPMPPFPVEDGMVSGRLEDESGKFNLNDLVGADGTRVNEDAKKFFELLLKRVGLAPELSQSTIDWIDSDDLTVGPMGAESNYYQGLSPGYASANAPFNAIEDLKQVRGFEGQNYDLIAPYISALPETTTKININIAPPLLLASLDDKLDVNTVAMVLQDKQKKMEHFANVSELLAVQPFDSISDEGKNLANKMLDVKSDYFKIQVEVILNNRKRQLTSRVYRKDKQVTLYARSMAPFIFQP